MIKAIIFDCFGVLTKDWWREFLSSVPAGTGKERAKQLNHQYDAGQMSLQEFAKGVADATDRQPKPIEQMFSVPESLKNTELLDYIKTLKPKYKIGMLSNIGTNWVREVFLTKQEQQLFDDMVFSFEVGATKPDPKIYKTAIERLGVKAEETVFVDDVETYCLSARKLGLHAITYKDFDQMKTELQKILAASPDN